jgi:hypothetical protein
MAETPQALAYQEALRAITQQQDVLKDIRGRSSTLLGVASISTSFLGGIALNKQDPHGLSWVAVGAFVVLGGLTLAILLPRAGWTFRFSARKLIAEYIETDSPAELAEIHRDLALHLENHYDSNGQHLRVLFWLFRIATAVLVIEILMWLLAIAR